MAGARLQPQGTARLVRGNPLAVTDVWIGSSALTLVKGYVAQATSSTSGIMGAGSGGRFVRGDGASLSSGYQISDNSNNLLGSVGTTWAIVRRCRDTTVRPIYMHYGYDLGANNRCLLGAPEEGNITWDFGNATTGSGRLQAPYVKDTLMETLVVVAGQVKGREIWRRGVKLAGNPAAKALRNMDAAPFGIGRVNGNTASDDVETYMVIVSNKEWSDAEIRAWSANPWSVVDAPSMRMAFPEVAGISATANWTEVSENTGAAAAVQSTATGGWTEGSDNAAVSAAGSLGLSAAWTEAPEASALQAMVGSDIAANASWVEAAEASSVAASTRVAVTANWIEGAEGATVDALVGGGTAATASWTEAPDSFNTALAVRAAIAITWTEKPDAVILRASGGDGVRPNAALVPKRRTVVFEGGLRVVTF